MQRETEAKRGATAFQESYSGSFTTVSDSFLKQEWNVATARNNAKRRYGELRFLVTLGTFLSVSAGTLALHGALRIACLWLAAMTIIVPVDGFAVFERFLALPSRILLGAMSALLAACFWRPVKNLILLTSIVVSIGFWLIKTLNTKWLGSEAWMITDTAQEAMIAGADGNASVAWQANGKRATRWMLAQMGLPCTEDALDVIHRAVWIAGYLAALKSAASGSNERQRLKARVEKLQNDVARLQKHLNLKEEELRQCQERDEPNDLQAWESKKLQARINEQDAWIERLLKENESLRSGIEADNAALGEREKALLIKKYKDAGMSQNEAGRKVGVSPATATRLMKKALQEKWFENEETENRRGMPSPGA